MAEFASDAKGNVGVTLGAIGTGLSVLSGAGSMLLGGMGQRAGDLYDRDRHVTWREFEMTRGYEKALADKEHQLNMADMERISTEHDIEVYKQVRSEIKAVDDKLNAEVRRLDREHAEQLVWNATNAGVLGCLKNQVEQLQGLTKLVIPNSSCCPGWGPVTVAPATPT